MDQLLRTLFAHSENRRSVPGTHIRHHILALIPALENLTLSSGLLGTEHKWCIYIHTGKNIHT